MQLSPDLQTLFYFIPTTRSCLGEPKRLISQTYEHLESMKQITTLQFTMFQMTLPKHVD